MNRNCFIFLCLFSIQFLLKPSLVKEFNTIAEELDGFETAIQSTKMYASVPQFVEKCILPINKLGNDLVIYYINAPADNKEKSKDEFQWLNQKWFYNFIKVFNIARNNNATIESLKRQYNQMYNNGLL